MEEFEVKYIPKFGIVPSQLKEIIRLTENATINRNSAKKLIKFYIERNTRILSDTLNNVDKEKTIKKFAKNL